MNKLKIAVILLFVASTFFTQCLCQYGGDNPVGSFSNRLYYDGNYFDSSVLLPGTWQNIDASWIFNENGELEVIKDQKPEKGYWSVSSGMLNTFLDNNTKVFNVKVLSKNELQLTSDDDSFTLIKN